MPISLDGTNGITTPAIDFLTQIDPADIPNLDAAKITTGTLGAARVPDLDAAKITTGTVATARLASGTANNTTFLRGDSTWTAVTQPSTAFDGVGSYAILMNAANSDLAVGGTIAGSSLRYGYAGSGSIGGATRQQVNISTYNGGGSAVSGTWRKMNSGSSYFVTTECTNTLYHFVTHLYVRIS